MQKVPEGLRRNAEECAVCNRNKTAERGQQRSYRGGGKIGF